MKMSSLSYNTLDKIRHAGHPMMLRAGPGIGKTELVHDYAVDRGLGFVVEIPPTMDAPDVKGFLVPTKDASGMAISHFTLPDWLRRIRAEIERTGVDEGILFLDEFSAGDHLVQKALSPILSERRVGEWELPDGWVVWMASNRVTDKAGVNRLLGHTANRMAIIDVEPDVVGWTTWANNHGVHPMYIAFANQFPGVVFNTDPPNDPNEPRITPRSLMYAHDFHAKGVHGMHLDSDNVTQGIVQGFIGKGAAAQFFGYIKVANELPTIEEIENSPTTAKLPPVERLDAQYAAMSMCISAADSSNVDALFTYVVRLNKELQTSAVQQLLRKNGAGHLLNSQVLSKWLAENKALVSSTLV